MWQIFSPDLFVYKFPSLKPKHLYRFTAALFPVSSPQKLQNWVNHKVSLPLHVIHRASIVRLINALLVIMLASHFSDAIIILDRSKATLLICGR